MRQGSSYNTYVIQFSFFFPSADTEDSFQNDKQTVVTENVPISMNTHFEKTVYNEICYEMLMYWY